MGMRHVGITWPLTWLVRSWWDCKPLLLDKMHTAVETCGNQVQAGKPENPNAAKRHLRSHCGQSWALWTWKAQMTIHAIFPFESSFLWVGSQRELPTNVLGRCDLWWLDNLFMLNGPTERLIVRYFLWGHREYSPAWISISQPSAWRLQVAACGHPQLTKSQQRM